MVKTIVSVIATIAVVAFFIVFDGRKKTPAEGRRFVRRTYNQNWFERGAGS